MNAERLHEICIVVRDAVASRSIDELLHRVVNTLQETVNQPQSPERQQELSAALDDFYAALSGFPTDSFSPAWREVVDEIGGSELLGLRLAGRVRDIVERNQITPATAQQQIAEVAAELDEFVTALNQIATSFDRLGIGRDALAPGECELGVLIPRRAVEDGFGEFVGELDDLGFVLRTFSEVVAEDPSELQVRTISSSDLMVFLAAAPGLCATIALSAERLTSAYKNLLEIKRLKREMKDQGVPEKSLKSIDTHANKIMSDTVGEVTVQIMDEYYIGGDDGRRNELSNAVRISLNKLANKIDRGFSIEVRAEPPESNADEEDEADEQEKIRNHIQLVIDVSQALQYIRPEGEPILHLPEGNGSRNQDDEEER